MQHSDPAGQFQSVPWILNIRVQIEYQSSLQPPAIGQPTSASGKHARAGSPIGKRINTPLRGRYAPFTLQTALIDLVTDPQSRL